MLNAPHQPIRPFTKSRISVYFTRLPQHRTFFENKFEIPFFYPKRPLTDCPFLQLTSDFFQKHLKRQRNYALIEHSPLQITHKNPTNDVSTEISSFFN